jgi:hypothetical protein
MMQYGGELVGNNLRQNGPARCPPLPAGPIKPALPAVGRPNHLSVRTLIGIGAAVAR